MAYQKKAPGTDLRRRLGIVGKRVGFDKSGAVLCKGCFDLRNENEILKQKVIRLTGLLKYSQTGAKKMAIGAHTPSSKIEKPNSEEEDRRKRGGQKKGHRGFGRKSCSLTKANEVITVETRSHCGECRCELEKKDFRNRTVIESVPVVSRRVIYRLQRSICPKCSRQYRAKAPALKKSLYGNSLISQAAVMHYEHGVPMGRVLSLLGENVTLAGLIGSFHRLGEIAGLAKPALIKEYRNSFVRHADETGWRNDGRSGYGWLFCSDKTSIFEFRNTRASSVPREILGEDPLDGVLVVDRYAAYNKMPVNLQYCYAHLLREVGKVAQEFHDDNNVTDFCERFGLCLTQAMKLRSQLVPDEEYYRQAQALKKEMKALVAENHKHLAIQNIQTLFHSKRYRLYHWVKHRKVPPENNRAERELRPTVIARKVSFGSQSEAGAKTRGNIMSLLYTAKKRLNGKPTQIWLKETLDQLARTPSKNIYSLLPKLPDNVPHCRGQGAIANDKKIKHLRGQKAPGKDLLPPCN